MYVIDILFFNAKFRVKHYTLMMIILIVCCRIRRHRREAGYRIRGQRMHEGGPLRQGDSGVSALPRPSIQVHVSFFSCRVYVRI